MEARANIAEALRRGHRLLREDPRRAAAEARSILAAAPGNADAHRLLGAALRRCGEDEAAARAELDAIHASVGDPLLMRAAAALLDDDLAAAEQLLRPRLKQKPTDVAAIRMMAELAARLGRYRDSENLLRRALELAPAWGPARANLATVLYKENRAEEALAELDRLEAADEEPHRNLRAAALGRLGAYQEAIALYEAVLERMPGQPKVWMSLGHLRKTVGRGSDSVAAYRRAVALLPGLGEAWWSLANLKTFRFAAADVAAMELALDAPGLADEDRFHLHFALGKAHEDAGEPARAFTDYAEGNRLRRAAIDYDPAEISGHVERSIALFTSEFLAARSGWGCPDRDPIFILGMPRAGSTLIEQILASHPEVEGTMELPDIPALAQRLNGRKRKGDPSLYPECLAELGAEELSAMGEEYLRSTRVQRKTGKPLFIDKMPNNWAHLGLIRLILPNARIVDARRHPLACGFSNFKQHFARGQGFSYDLADMGRYYRDYVALMDHMDSVQPGRIHRVIHEELVDDPEAGIRRLLAALGLPFDPACLAFHENERAVRTASAEQVRRPINREGLESWRAFEPHLGALKEALGPALDDWR
jgi:tetratricopeptide (TPR) repeat protein